MKRVLVSVEGQAEETFVQEILRKYLWTLNVDIQPIIIATSRVKGNKFKGGVVSYGKVRHEVLRLLHTANIEAVTTLYDLYHLPTDFPGYGTRPVGSGHLKAKHLEQAFEQDIRSPRFRAQLQVHEFEAFLFVNPERTATLFPDFDHAASIRKIRQNFLTPEDINDSPQTAPSKRIQTLYSKYDKNVDGILAVLEVGLDELRAECPHFREWLEWLESFGES